MESGRFMAQSKLGTHGTYDTPQEAALARARALAAAAAPLPPLPSKKGLSAEAAQAVNDAAAEGLTFERSERSSSGYNGVASLPNGHFEVRIKGKYIGHYDTAEEAALVRARELAAAETGKPPVAPPSTEAAQAVADAAAEGLTLEPSAPRQHDGLQRRSIGA